MAETRIDASAQLSMQDIEFLRFAEDVIKSHPGNKAAMRSAISRAYYSSYHRVLAYYDELVPRERDADTRAHPGFHTRLVDAFEFCEQFADAPSIAADLKILKAQRHQADYKLDSTNVEATMTAEDAVELARGIIKLVEDCRINNAQDDLMKHLRSRF